jgi:membrane-anchored protein YejM (alkaline phosphatase superfamily)
MALTARCIARRCCLISRCRRAEPVDEQTASQWINWLQRYAQEDNRWFSWVAFNGTTLDDSNQKGFAAATAARRAMLMHRLAAC